MTGLMYKPSNSKSSEAVDQDTLEDPRKLSVKDRAALAAGPKIDVYVGGTLTFRKLPKKAFLAFSNFGQDALKRHPNMNSISLNPGQVSLNAVRRVCDYINGNCIHTNTFSLKSGPTLAENVDVYRAGALFDMAAHMKAPYHNIRTILYNGTISEYDELDVIANIEDGLFTAAAEILEICCYQGRIRDLGGLKSWLAKHLKFEKAMEDYSAMKAAEKAKRTANRKAAQQGIANRKAAEQKASQAMASKKSASIVVPKWPNVPEWPSQV